MNESHASAHLVLVWLLSNELVPLVLTVQEHADMLDGVALLVSKDMTGRVSHAKSALGISGRINPDNIHVVKLGELPADQRVMAQLMEDSLKRVTQRWPDSQLLLDFTGGTKPMALALHGLGQRLQDAGQAVSGTYADTQSCNFLSLLPGGEPRPMHVSLDVKEMLATQGRPVQRIRAAANAPSTVLWGRRSVTEDVMMVQKTDTIARLNHIVHPARIAYGRRSPDTASQPLKLRYNEKDSPRVTGGLADLVAALERHGALTPEWMDGTRLSSITFHGKDWADYLSGDWLEDWAFIQAHDAGLEHFAAGVEISTNNKTDNEFDLIATHQNRLLLLEAKTAIMVRSQGGRSDDGKKAKSDSGQQSGADRTRARGFAYELDSKGSSLARQFNTKVMLSFHPIGEVDLARFRDNGIVVFAPWETCSGQFRPHPIAELCDRLVAWAAGTPLPQIPVKPHRAGK